MRQIILDTETTGLSTADGHRIIEVGCLEMIDRRFTKNHFHYYINPQREIEAGAQAVHGITNEFLVDKPVFKDISTALFEFINGAELIIHNASFDIGFLDYEYKLIDPAFTSLLQYCGVIDTLLLARQKHPGLQNNLDALCRRYQVDNSSRDLHGALLDARLLGQVYLAMTGGQSSLFVEEGASQSANQQQQQRVTIERNGQLRVIYANDEELAAHQKSLKTIAKASGDKCVWKD